MGLVRLSSAIRAKVIPLLRISDQQRLQPVSTETRVGGARLKRDAPKAKALYYVRALEVVGISQSDPLQNFPPCKRSNISNKGSGKKILLDAEKRSGHEQAPICRRDPIVNKVNTRQQDYIDPSNTSNAVRGKCGLLSILTGFLLMRWWWATCGF